MVRRPRIPGGVSYGPEARTRRKAGGRRHANPGKAARAGRDPRRTASSWSPPAAWASREPEETEATFTGNALLKARAAAEASGPDRPWPTIPAFRSPPWTVRPGIFSARWGGPEKDFAGAMKKVEDAVSRRSAPTTSSAWFTCALAVAWPGGPGGGGRGPGRRDAWSFRAAATRGFGYDPIFQPQRATTMTFGEMDPEEKDAISHRALAFAQAQGRPALTRTLGSAPAGRSTSTGPTARSISPLLRLQRRPRPRPRGRTGRPGRRRSPPT